MATTKHAVKRMRQRLGLSRRAALREAERAADGLRLDELPVGLRAYLDDKYSPPDLPRPDYRVLAHAIFVYRDGVMTTVLKVPPEYRAELLRVWRQRRLTSA